MMLKGKAVKVQTDNDAEPTAPENAAGRELVWVTPSLSSPAEENSDRPSRAEPKGTQQNS